MTERSKLAPYVIQINNNGMGFADIPLQHQMIRRYLMLMNEYNMLPAAICFYTEGVKLAVDGSPVLDILQSLENKGVRLILCINCLKHYGLTDQVQVGIVGSLADIIEAQWQAKKVITI